MLPVKYFKDITIKIDTHYQFYYPLTSEQWVYVPVFEQDKLRPLPLTDESTGDTGYNYGNDVETDIELHGTLILFRNFGKTILANEEQFKKLWSRVHEEVYEYSFGEEEEDTVEIIMKQIIENQNNDTIVFENMKKLKYFCFLKAKNLNCSGGLIDHEFTDMNFYCLDKTCDPERDNQNPLQMFVYSLLLKNLEKDKDNQCFFQTFLQVFVRVLIINYFIILSSFLYKAYMG